MDFELHGQKFNWWEEKAERNFHKHGIQFQEAAEAMLDEQALMFDDEEHSTEEEERYTAIGRSYAGRLLRVTFRELPSDVVHIITARLASGLERRRYDRGY